MIGLSVSPLAQTGLDEALGLAVGFRRVGLGADVFEAEPLAQPAEGEGPVAGAVVGHDALDLDSEAIVVGESGLEEAGGASLLLVGHDLGEGDAGVVVDGDMDELPAEPFAPCPPVALPSAVAGDAMTDSIDSTELFDVEVDHLARMFTLIPAHRLRRLQGRELVEPEPPQDAADSGGRHPDLRCDLLAGAALTPKRRDLIDNGLRGRPMQAMRSGTAIA